MPNRSFKIYQSSAGSGKTYTLTREYLKLAFTRPNYYKHILAVTFTNKAMQEMKNRIIHKLDEFSKAKFDTMAEDLMIYLNVEKSDFQNKSRELLSKILHGYSHFSVSTIDSFFQKVIRSFSRELGLAGSYRLELDYDLILIQIVNDLLLEVEKNTHLRKWLIMFTMERLGDGKSWDVQKELRAFANELFKEELQDIETNVLLKKETEILKFLHQVNELVISFESQMHSLAKEGLRVMHQFGLNVDDFTQKKRGVAGHLEKILSSNDFKPNSYVYQAVNENKWYPSKSLKANAIEQALDEGLRTTIEDALELYDKGHPKYATAQVIRKFIYGYGLLSDLSRKLREYKNEHDVMLISDATRFLRGLVKDTDAPFVYEKVGSFFNHYLIDEFQDTSIFQWESFRPLIENSLAEGQQNLLVGDVKQSIYRWRGGDLELLRKTVLDQLGPHHTEILQLDSNFRSEANVIHFNNALFEELPDLFNQRLAEKISEQGVLPDYFDEVYGAVSQQIPDNKLQHPKGYVSIKFFEDEEDYSWIRKVNESLPGMLETLQDLGIPLRDTAILVRENKEGKAIADLLMNHQEVAKPGYRFDVVSSESLFLSSSSAVNTLIAALRYLYNPNDSVNKAELAYNFKIRFKNGGADFHGLFSSVNSKKGFQDLLPVEFIENLRVFISIPLYELIEKLIEIFKLNRIIGQYAYLQTFQDQVLKFIGQEKADIPSFLIWWDETGKKQSIKVADDLDAIKILTIHKAKGLEFHTVLMPYGNWSLDHKINPIIWNSITEEPFNVGPLPLRYSRELSNTYFKTDYFTEMSKAYLDSLNMLYVGMTRAVNNLIVNAPKKEIRKQGICELVYNLVSSKKFSLNECWNAGEQCFEFGELDNYEGGHTDKIESIKLDEYLHFNWRSKITVKHPTELLETTDERKSKINYGNLVHRILSYVKSMDDFKRALDLIYFEESLSGEQAEELRAHLKLLFENKEVRKWFAQGWKVKNEAPILTKDGEYRPDRVIWRENDTLVIDYKTGAKKNEHVKQVRHYKELLEKMEYQGIRAYLWYLKDGEVVEC